MKKFLIDLEQFGGVDPNGLFPFILIKIADILASKLAVISCILIWQGSFLVCWRNANVTALPKSPTLSQTPSEYRPTSITPILSKIFERLLVKRLYSFVNRLKVLPPTQFGFRMGLGSCDVLHLTHDMQLALDEGFETILVSLDFSSAFDFYAGLTFKLQSIGVGGLLLSI